MSTSLQQSGLIGRICDTVLFANPNPVVKNAASPEGESLYTFNNPRDREAVRREVLRDLRRKTCFLVGIQVVSAAIAWVLSPELDAMIAGILGFLWLLSNTWTGPLTRRGEMIIRNAFFGSLFIGVFVGEGVHCLFHLATKHLEVNEALWMLVAVALLIGNSLWGDIRHLRRHWDKLDEISDWQAAFGMTLTVLWWPFGAVWSVFRLLLKRS